MPIVAGSTLVCPARQGSQRTLSGMLFSVRGAGHGVQYLEIVLSCHAPNAGLFQLGLSATAAPDRRGRVPAVVYAGATPFAQTGPRTFRLRSAVPVACVALALRPGTTPFSALTPSTTFAAASCPPGRTRLALAGLIDLRRGRADLTVRFGRVTRRLAPLLAYT